MIPGTRSFISVKFSLLSQLYTWTWLFMSALGSAEIYSTSIKSPKAIGYAKLSKVLFVSVNVETTSPFTYTLTKLPSHPKSFDVIRYIFKSPSSELENPPSNMTVSKSVHIVGMVKSGIVESTPSTKKTRCPKHPPASSTSSRYIPGARQASSPFAPTSYTSPPRPFQSASHS